MYRRYYYEEVNRRETNCCVYFLIALGILTAICAVSFIVLQLDPSYLSKILEDLAHEREVTLAFTDFKNAYDRTYSTPEEESARRAIFKANYERIIATNKEQEDFKLGVNKFADLTQDEFRALYLTKPEYVDLTQFDYTSQDSSARDYLDVTKDWEATGYMNPIRDQGNCGSCWTFASVAAAEAMYAIQNNRNRLQFSEQQLVDCIKSEWSNGCDGGERWEGIQHIADKGITDRAEYPYEAIKKRCRLGELKTTRAVGGYENITSGDNVALAKAILENPVTVGVNASPFNFMFYKEGIVTKGCPSDEINHAVVVVGIGNEGQAYWRIRNSWGVNWGESGHIRIARVADKSPGLCGVAVKACSPKRL